MVTAQVNKGRPSLSRIVVLLRIPMANGNNAVCSRSRIHCRGSGRCSTQGPKTGGAVPRRKKNPRSTIDSFLLVVVEVFSTNKASL